jgi:hypothetical protein
LELWWSKHLYTPFDQYLDRTYQDALTLTEENNYNNNNNNKGNRHRHKGNYNNNHQKRVSSSTKRDPQRNDARNRGLPSGQPVVTGTPSFAFHKRYVQDVSDLVQDVDDPREQVKIIQKNALSLNSKQFYRMARVPNTGVTYIAPGTGAGRGGTFSRKDAFADLLSLLVLGSLDDMIYVQGIENRKLKEPKPLHARL